MPDPDNTQPKKPDGLIRRLIKMSPDSVPKTVCVAVLLCLVASMVVSAAAVALRPIQDENRLLDKQAQVLRVAGLYEPGIDVAEAFQALEPKVLELATGEFTDQFDPYTFDDRQAANDITLSTPLEDDPASIRRQAKYVTVYLKRQAEGGGISQVILPVHGYGLWSTLYGFMAIEADGNTVSGLIFYEHAETPGLGAEVDNPRWRNQWPGKKLRDDEGELEITVAKTAPPAGEEYHVDALSGATLTSNGVDNLVRFWMGERGFEPFLERVKAGEV